MESSRGDEPTAEVLICADVLGAFGVTPADVLERSRRRSGASRRLGDPAGDPADERSLERSLADALENARDRTAAICEFVCHADRGLECEARYRTTDLASELEDVFAGIGWTCSLAEVDGGRRLALEAADDRGRTRTRTIRYPRTPLETDNLPAVLATINEEVLFGVEARFVLLSTGVDRWQAALVRTEDLEGLRDRYGERISPFDRPLLPEHGLEDYLEESGGAEGDPRGDGPWPAWALERADRRSGSTAEDDPHTGPGSGPVGSNAADSNATDSSASVNSASTGSLRFVEEAESDQAVGDVSPRRTVSTRSLPADSTASGTESAGADGKSPATGATHTRIERPDEASSARSPSGSSSSASNTNASAGVSTSAESGGLTLAGGSPTVARVSGDDGGASAASTAGPANSPLESDGPDDADEPDDTDDGATADRNDRESVVTRRERRETSTEGFGTLSGPVKTARVSNDSFGAGVEPANEDERFQALGAAIGTGRNVSVKGLLEDDEFLPELPAVEPVETRIEFDEEFDPGALPKAKAAAEQSGFVWVDSGRLETTRVSGE